MNKRKQKESLSLRIAKIILAVVITTGLGTIIIGGGVVIMKYYNSEVNDKIIKPVDQNELRICNKDSDCYEYSPCGMGFSCFNKTEYEILVRNNVNISCPHVEIMPWQSYRYNREECACSEGNCVKVFSKERYCKSLENSFKWCGENKPSKYPYDPEDDECLKIEDLLKENCINEKNIELNTSDWQTYRNEEFGFEVKYPENFVAREYYQRRYNVFGAMLYAPNQPDPYLVIRNRSWNKYSFERWLENIEATSIEETQNITAGNLTFEAYATDKKQYYFINEKDSTFEISTTFIRDSDETFNQILSTFKFTEE